MNKITLLAAFSAVLPTAIFAQSDVLAHWDFNDGQRFEHSLMPEDNGIDCITPDNVDPGKLTWSYSTIDSEGDAGSYGANCFRHWDASRSVDFKVNFANEAVVDVKEISFDVGNYGQDHSDLHRIKQVSLRIWKNDIEITSSGQFVKDFDSGVSNNPWTASSDTSFDVSGLGISSAAGSSDDYRFSIFVTDTIYTSDARIALDNFRVIGSHECVPEPSSAALLGLAGMAMLIRRKR